MSNQVGTAWTEEREALLKEIHAQGSNAWVARIINERTGSNFSRSAIIGKRMRSGLCTEVSKHRNRLYQRPSRRKTTELSVFEDVPAAEFLNVPLLAIGKDQCRYARGGDGEPYLFCGQPTKENSSYCPHHHSKVWVRPRKYEPAHNARWQSIGSVATKIVGKIDPKNTEAA